MRREEKFSRGINVIWVVQSPLAKIFLFSFDPNHFYILRRPVPHKGRLEIVTDAGQDAVDAGSALTNALSLRTAKSCGPDAPTLASSW